MGVFSKMFGQQQQYPELSGDHAAAQKLAAIQSNLEELTQKVTEPMEVIPSDDGAYVFIGKPPKDFGIAWIKGDKLHSLKTLAEEQGVKPAELKELSDNLRKIYEANLHDDRFTTKIGRKNIVVTPSEQFSHQVSDVIRQVSH